VMQMPAPAVAQMRKSPMWPGLEKLAHTLSYDLLITARGPMRLLEPICKIHHKLWTLNLGILNPRFHPRVQNG
jgi:hypothetical protein